MERRIKASSETTAFLVMMVVGLVLLNVLSYFFYTRLDLTERHLHTLSGGTKRLLSSLEDTLSVRAYFSEDLPPPFNSHERAVRDLLDEYAAYSGGKLRVEIIHPDGSQDLEKRAEDDGVTKVPHAALQEDEAREVLGYRGVAFSYRGETKAIPVLSRSADISGLEYDFTTTIRQITGDRRTIGFVSGHGEPTITPPPPQQNPMMPEEDQDPGISYLNKLIDTYNLRPVTLGSTKIDDEFRGLVVVGPTEQIPEADLYALDQYLMRGGAVAFFLNGTTVEEAMDGITARANDGTGLEKLLRSYGAELHHDIVMDTQTDRFLVTGQVRTPLGNLPMSIPRPYPAWPHMAANEIDEESPLLYGLPGVTLLWPSTVRVTREAAANKNIKAKVLIRTSNEAWSVSDNFQLDPRQEDQEWLEQQKRASVRARTTGFPLAVELTGTFHSAFPDGRPAGVEGGEGEPGEAEHLAESRNPGRILVVGDADFLKIDYVGSNRRPQHTPSNLTFMMNTLDWLAEDADLIEVRAKRLEDPSLPEMSDAKRNWIKWGNIAAWPILFLIFGVVRWSFRKNARAQIERSWNKGGKSA